MFPSHSRKAANMALNLAPFGRWTLRDKAAQRRLGCPSTPTPWTASKAVAHSTISLRKSLPVVAQLNSMSPNPPFQGTLEKLRFSVPSGLWPPVAPELAR